MAESLFQEILKAFAGVMGQWVGGAIALILLGLAAVIGLKYLSKNTKDARFLTVILRIAKTLLAKRLGNRGNAVFDALLSGLDSIKDGQFTQDEMADELTSFVKVALMNKFTLTDADLAIVREIARTVVGFFEPRKQAAPEAVKIMMMQSK